MFGPASFSEPIITQNKSQVNQGTSINQSQFSPQPILTSYIYDHSQALPHINPYQVFHQLSPGYPITAREKDNSTEQFYR
jgi:hypothetical protein